MKKPLFLFILSAALSVSASANNLDQGGELPGQKTEQSSFSINKKFLSLFTLFCVEESKPDSVQTRAKRELDLTPVKED